MPKKYFVSSCIAPAVAVFASPLRLILTVLKNVPRIQWHAILVLSGALSLSAGCGNSSTRAVDARGPSSTDSIYPGDNIGETPGGTSRALKPGAVIYGVIPGLLGHHPFRDLKESMSRLHDEGIDVVWISPINATDEAGSLLSYSVTDYFQLRPDFGTEAEFREVIQEAHHYNIRVLMDFVANHTSNQHPYFQDALKRGKASPYYDYYDRDAHGEATHYFDWSNLMNLNYSNPKVAKMIKDALKHWTSDFGVDGFRFDAAWGVRQRAPHFWAEVRAELQREHPDVILLAEASARDPYYRRSGFDLAYDWGDELGHWAWENVFQDREQISSRLHLALTSASTSPATVARFLNNNDTQERFVTRFGVGMTRVAAALQFTLPGVPILYAGDEIGAEYMPYASPQPLDWSHDPNQFRSYYRKLIGIRKSTPAISGGDWKAILPTANPSTYAYVRGTADSAPVLIILNFGESSSTVELPMSPDFFATFGTKVLTDLLTDQKISVIVDSQAMVLRLSVPKETALILKH